MPIFKVPVRPLHGDLGRTSSLWVFPKSLPHQLVSLQQLLICPGHSSVTHHHLMGIKMFLIVYNPFDLLPQLRTWKHATALQAGAVVA